MALFFLVVVFMAVIMGVMAVGVILQGKCLRGSCGGQAIYDAHGDMLNCDSCPVREDCEPEAQ